MTTISFTDQHQRLNRLLTNALEGCLIDSVVEETEERLVVNAHRVSGQKVGVRFLGVHLWEASAEPQPNASIVLKGIGVGGGRKAFLRAFVPWLQHSLTLGSRVRIDIGGARLTIDCEDAEWWQGETVLGREGSPT